MATGNFVWGIATSGEAVNLLRMGAMKITGTGTHWEIINELGVVLAVRVSKDAAVATIAALLAAVKSNIDGGVTEVIIIDDY